MYLKNCINIFIIIFININIGFGLLYKCPMYRLHFEKVLGYRPLATDAATAENTIYNQNNLLYHETVKKDSLASINLECWKLCKSNIECLGYILFYNTSDCYSLTPTQRQMDVDSESTKLVADANAVYFQKICLNVPEKCESKLWPITRIPGSNLINQGFKRLSKLVTRRECAEKCLFEIEFICRSASFTISHRNNYKRLYNDLKRSNEQVGICTLSKEDKTSQSDSFRVANEDEEYIENQCSEHSTTDDYCSYEQYINSTLVYYEFQYNGLTQKQCKEKCSSEIRFLCQGVSFISDISGGEKTNCLLHSEDVISLGPRAVHFRQGSVYFRRVKCLNLSVICYDKEMLVKYTPTQWFNGKIYVNSYSEQCSVDGNGTSTTILKLPIGNEMRENRCGIIRAYEIGDSGNRTLISTLIVIQMNSKVQTQGDRLVRVGCILNNSTYSTNGLPDDLAIGSSIQFNSLSQPPSQGSLVINTSAILPTVTMQIIDLGDHRETTDAQLGQNLELRILMNPPSSLYDIRAVNLTAHSSEDETNSIQLIDENGCPVDEQIFPQLQKTISSTTRFLSARFHAFKFTGTSSVLFEVIINFCMIECPPLNCRNGTLSHDRHRRNTEIIFGQKIVNNPYQPIKFPVPNQTTFTFPGPSSKSLVRLKKSVEIPEVFSYQNYPNESQDSKVNNDVIFDGFDSVDQRVLSNYKPAETDSANVKETTRSNFTDNKRILRKVVRVPLQLNLNVHGPNIVESESLIYGENSHILVAGIELDHNDNIVCINQTLMLIVLLFWLFLQIILMSGCCILINKYKRIAEMEEDRASLQKIHQSLGFDNVSRHVHWADNGARIVYS